MHLRIAKSIFNASLAGACLFIGLSPAGAQDAAQRLYVVTHVDIYPPTAAAEAATMVQQFAADSRKDHGSVRFEILREVARANHLTLVEIWQSKQDFENHLGAGHTRAFREKIQPILGGPLDERLHVLLQ